MGRRNIFRIGAGALLLTVLPACTAHEKYEMTTRQVSRIDSDEKTELVVPTKEEKVPEQKELESPAVSYDFLLGYGTSHVTFTYEPEENMYRLHYREEGSYPTETSNRISVDIFNRLTTVISRVAENEQDFNQKAATYNRMNLRLPTTSYMLSHTMYCFAMRPDEIEGADEIDFEKEFNAELWLEEIEYILSIKEPQRICYSIYDEILSSRVEMTDGEQKCLYEYRKGDDQFVSVVDYEEYLDAWNYYTDDSPAPYSDVDSDYVIFADLGFYCNVDLEIEDMALYDGELCLVLRLEHDGMATTGGGTFMVIQVPPGTGLGTVDFVR